MTVLKKEMRIFLEKYSSRQKCICPNCGKKTFVHYVDKETGARVGEGEFGRCDREIECAYHARPSFGIKRERSFFDHKPYRITPPSVYDTLSFDYVSKSGARLGDGNVFVDWLRRLFYDDLTYYLIKKYHIGTTKKGETIYWQIDERGSVRAGKTILYDNYGKRRKDVNPPVNWVHSILIQAGVLSKFELKQCLFGLHLLIENKASPIYVFESEKTAIIASVYYRQTLCVATGALQNLKKELLEPLRGRVVTFFPDKGATQIWREKLISFGFGKALISPLDGLETLALGADLADTLPICKVTGLALNTAGGYPIFWDY